MLYFVMTAGFEDVVKADDVALDVGVRICDGVTHSCLSGEIDDNGEIEFLKKVIDHGFISDVCLDESPVLAKGFDFLQALVFDVHIVVVRDGVHPYDLDVFKLF